MKHSLTVLALLGCTMLGACGTENRGLESVHQPVVARTDYVYDLPASSDRLTETGLFNSHKMGSPESRSVSELIN